MNKYLITGGQGFIGSNIVEKSSGVSFDVKSGFDILDQNRLQAEIVGVRGVFHCAAKISVPESFKLEKEYYRVNVEGTRSVIENAEKFGTKIVFSSSAAVYGELSIRAKEDMSPNPKSPYAENKRDAEELLRSSAVPHIALRYFNVYGPGQSPEYAGVITHFINNALQGKDLIIYGDGKQVRDFIFVDDIVEANIMAMNYKNKKFEIFNVGSGIDTSINDLAKMIIRLTGSKSNIVYLPAREGDIVYSQADVSKAKRILGWQAKTCLEEGLRRTIESYRS